MTFKKIIQILLLSMVVLSTISEAVVLDVNNNVEIKFEQEKENDSNEKEEIEKKESKYLEDLHGISMESFLLSSCSFSSPSWFHQIHIDEEIIPPEV